MLGLLPEARAEEILAEYRPELQAMGFQLGVLTGELSVRPGAHGFQEAQTVGRDGLSRIPLAVAAGPVAIPMPGVDLTLTWATLTPRDAWLRLRAVRVDDGGDLRPTPKTGSPEVPASPPGAPATPLHESWFRARRGDPVRAVSDR
jgi:hypothetical protein